MTLPRHDALALAARAMLRVIVICDDAYFRTTRDAHDDDRNAPCATDDKCAGGFFARDKQI